MDLHVTYSLLVVERLNDCYIPIIDLVGMIVRFLRLETKPCIVIPCIIIMLYNELGPTKTNKTVNTSLKQLDNQP